MSQRSSTSRITSVNASIAVPTAFGFLAVSLAMSLNTGAARAQCYRVIPLDDLGGAFSSTNDVNDAPHVAGVSRNRDGNYRAFIYASGAMRDLGVAPGGDDSYANAINAESDVVGQSDALVDDRFMYAAAVWRNHQVELLETLIPYGWGEAFDINNTGLIVGESTADVGMTAPVVWRNGEIEVLPNRFGATSYGVANAVNDDGLIVGISDDRAVYWDTNGGNAQLLPTLGFGTNGSATGVSSAGLIIGRMPATSYNDQHAVVWENFEIRELELLPGHRFSYANALNDLGQIVGRSFAGGHGGGSGEAAVLWENGIAFDLNDLLQPNTSYFIDAAYGINNHGEIVVNGECCHNTEAILLQPIPNGMGLTKPKPGTAGEANQFVMRGATPGNRIFFVAGFDAGSTSVPNCPGVSVGIDSPRIFGSVLADSFGHAIVARLVPAQAEGITFLMQAVEPKTCRTTNVLAYRFR